MCTGIYIYIYIYSIHILYILLATLMLMYVYMYICIGCTCAPASRGLCPGHWVFNTMTLKGFTPDGRDARDIMDNEQHNPPQIVWHAIWLLPTKVCADIDPMLVKPVGHINHVQSASVANERALAPFVRDEVLLPKKIRYKWCKHRVKRVRDVQL